MAGIRVDASDLKKAGKIAREFGPELNRQLLRQLRAAGRVGANVAKSSIRAMPSKSGDEAKSAPRPMTLEAHLKAQGRHTIVDERGSGNFTLRELIAQAVTVNASAARRPDVRIRVRKTAPLQQIGAAGLPKAINNGRWRHPLFGNREHWYPQTGVAFFDRPIEMRREEMKALVQKALDDAVRIASARGVK